MNEHSTIWPNWKIDWAELWVLICRVHLTVRSYHVTYQMSNIPNDYAELWVLICTVHLTVGSHHITYAFQSESTLYIFLHANKLLARNRCNIGSLSNCSSIRTHNHLIRKRTLNQLAKHIKWLSWVVSAYLYGGIDCICSSWYVRVSQWMQTLYLPESETHTWYYKNIQSNAPYRWVLTTQLNHLGSLAKWVSVPLRTKWSWVKVPL